jgi:hypothetical protein
VSAPPLAIVAGAVAGDGLERVARLASEALGHPVAVICPSPGTPGVWPAEAVPAARLEELAAAAEAIVRLLGDGASDMPRDVVEELIGGPPADVEALVERGRRAGVDLTAGATAICVLGAAEDVVDGGGEGLLAHAGHGRVVVLASLAAGSSSEHEAAALAARLRGAGFFVGVSAPRRQPALLHEAVREAMLLAELSSVPEAAVAGQEETYRLLIGVLLRDADEVERLRTATISPLLAYDAEHATDLLVTLETFLAHHGSTTETAEAMGLHRHTVGYRLTRVQEVSGLSPYESDGRERLSLGLKAAHILAADQRLIATRIGSDLSRP